MPSNKHIAQATDMTRDIIRFSSSGIDSLSAVSSTILIQSKCLDLTHTMFQLFDLWFSASTGGKVLILATSWLPLCLNNVFISYDFGGACYNWPNGLLGYFLVVLLKQQLVLVEENGTAGESLLCSISQLLKLMLPAHRWAVYTQSTWCYTLSITLGASGTTGSTGSLVFVQPHTSHPRCRCWPWVRYCWRL